MLEDESDKMAFVGCGEMHSSYDLLGDPGNRVVRQGFGGERVSDR